MSVYSDSGWVVVCALFLLVSQSPPMVETQPLNFGWVVQQDKRENRESCRAFHCLTDSTRSPFLSQSHSTALCKHWGVWKVSSAVHSSSEGESNIGQY